MFNTLILQDHPGNVRRLGLPRRFHEWTAKIQVDHDRLLGAMNSDEPLIVDPAQAVLVVELTGGLESPVFLAVRMRTLIEQMCSTRADSYVPWDEWGRDAVVMEVPALHGTPCVFVHGAQVVVVQDYVGGSWDWLWRYIVQTVDFSLQGRSYIPVWGGGSGTEKRVLLKSDGCFILELVDGGHLSNLRSLSDGGLFFLVSWLFQSAGAMPSSDIMGSGWLNRAPPSEFWR